MDSVIKIKTDLKLNKFFPIITSFGYIFPHKRFNVIFKAFKTFLEHYPEAVFILVGEDRMNIRQMIFDHALTGSVILTGYVSESQAQHYLGCL